jgi:hypothetical protein
MAEQQFSIERTIGAVSCCTNSTRLISTTPRRATWRPPRRVRCRGAAGDASCETPRTRLPPVAGPAEAAGPDPTSRAVIESAFMTWRTTPVDALSAIGVPAARRRPLANLMISTLEGAIVLARTREDVTPLRDVARELPPLLDAAAQPRE